MGGIVGDGDEVEVGEGDCLALAVVHLLADDVEERGPVVGAEEDYAACGDFAGLELAEDREEFVEGAESAGQGDDCAGAFGEEDFVGEAVVDEVYAVGAVDVLGVGAAHAEGLLGQVLCAGVAAAGECDAELAWAGCAGGDAFDGEDSGEFGGVLDGEVVVGEA